MLKGGDYTFSLTSTMIKIGRSQIIGGQLKIGCETETSNKK
jgi:hypothetical protein